jgi:hypothetical protein
LPQTVTLRSLLFTLHERKLITSFQTAILVTITIKLLNIAVSQVADSTLIDGRLYLLMFAPDSSTKSS